MTTDTSGSSQRKPRPRTLHSQLMADIPTRWSDTLFNIARGDWTGAGDGF